jgi:hypothetical protein
MAFIPDQPATRPQSRFVPDVAPEDAAAPESSQVDRLAANPFVRLAATILPDFEEDAQAVTKQPANSIQPEGAVSRFLAEEERYKSTTKRTVPGVKPMFGGMEPPGGSGPREVEDTVSNTYKTNPIESWSADTLDKLTRISNAAMVNPGVAGAFANMVYQNGMREQMTDTTAKGLGFKDVEEYLDHEKQAFRDKALKDASVSEQIIGSVVAQVIDPVAMVAGGWGFRTPVGFTRNLKLAAGGSGYTGSLEALNQIAEDGTITDTSQVVKHAVLGGIAVPVLDKAIRVAGRIRTEGALKTLEKRTQSNITEGKMNPQAAYDKALVDSGMTPKDVASMVDGSGRTQHLPTAFNPMARPEILKQLRDMGKSPKDIQAMMKYDPIEGYVAATNKNGILKNLSNATSSITSAVGQGIDNIIRPISSELRKINPALLNATRKNELDINLDTNAWRGVAQPFLNIVSKLDKKTYAALRKSLINRDDVRTRAILNTLPNAKEAQAAKEQVDVLMGSLFDKYQKVGVELNWLDKYFPRYLKKGEYDRMVKKLGTDPRSPFAQMLKAKEEAKGFSSDLGTAVGNKSAALGRELRPDEIEALRADLKMMGGRRMPLSDKEGNDLMNSYLKGITPEGLKTPSAARTRVLDTVPDDLLEHYGSIEDMLTSYIDHAAHTINIRKFFGKHMQTNSDINANGTDSVGSFVNELLNNGEIHMKDVERLKDLLGSRFGYKPSGELVQDTKNLFYMTRLGQFKAALTQLGDLGVASYANGIGNTILALYRPAGVKLEDLGIRKIAEEFGTTSATANALNHVFKYSGFRAIDALGKRAHINGSLIKNKGLVKSAKGLEKFKAKWQPMFGDETNNLVSDLQKGRITENVKLMLFNELSDVQPVSLLEMPRAYLNSPNGRLFYAMKTFTIKQLDLLRRDAISKIKSGNGREKLEGMKNLMRYVMVVTPANMTAEQIKAFVSGQDVEYSDLVVSNLWKNFGLSDFLVQKIGTGKVASAIAETVLSNPVTGMAETVDTVVKDLSKFGEKFDSLKFLPAFAMNPGGGSVIYNLFGGGMEKYQEDQRKELIGGSIDEEGPVYESTNY